MALIAAPMASAFIFIKSTSVLSRSKTTAFIIAEVENEKGKKQREMKGRTEN